MIERLAYIKAHTDTAAQTLQNALKTRGRVVTVTAAPHSLTVWCGTNWLGRVTYEELAESGISAAADRLIETWTAEIAAPSDGHSF